jgi:hypothetical protein
LRAAERDPANELYDQACSLLEAAQGLRAAAGSWRSGPAPAASLGCIGASLHELRDAVPELRDTALTPADAEPDHGSNPGERVQDSRELRASCAGPVEQPDELRGCPSAGRACAGEAVDLS